MTPPSPLFLTIPEAAERLRVSESSVYRLLRTGQLRGRKLGRAWRVPVAAIEELAS